MSSDGSVASTGSRIRQFGLYRTIDARTNEFLKSSRKRQIRQGCACAAISTAITVTVVVSVILVYEYSINTESNTNKKLSLRPKWLGLINESDPLKIDSKFTKKINFDRTTLKLLPVLLKALNKNRYLEKIIEDYASSSPPYEITDGTENYFKKNIFSDAKNWLKMPSSKIYTLDYKTTPLIYLKPSSQRLDYLSRVRKIRNYERMLNYFDKMINDKVSYSKQSQELKTNYESTESPIKFDSNIKAPNETKILYKVDKHIAGKKHNTTKNKTKWKIANTTKSLIKKKKISKLPTNNTKRVHTKKINKEAIGCKCPNNMGQLINKLIVSLQELVPHVGDKKQIKDQCVTKLKHKSAATQAETHSTTELLLPESYTELTTEKITTTSRVIPVSTITDIPIKLTTSKIQTILTKPRIKVNQETTLSPLILLKEIMNENISTTQKSSLYTTETDQVVDSSQTSPSVLEISTDEPSQIITNSKSTIISTTVTTERNNYEEDNQVTTTDILVEQSLPLKDIEPSTEITSTIDNEHIFIKESTLKPIPTTSGSMLNYENYDTKTSNEETGSQTVNIPIPTTNMTTTGRTATTELIVPFKFNDAFIESSSSTENLLDSVAIMPDVKRPIMPLFKGDEYDDFFISTPKISTGLDNFDLHSLEIVKNKDTPDKYSNIDNNKLKNTLRKVGLRSKPSNYHPVIKNKDMDLINMRKMANLVYAPNPIDVGNEHSNINNITEKNVIRKNKFTGVLNTLTYSKSSTETEVNTTPTRGTEQGNNDNTGEEEFQEEWIKQSENIELPIAFNKSAINFSDDEIIPTPSDGDKMKSEDKIISEPINSMLPAIRPGYLEVRRHNEWKAEDHVDYDMDLASNFFDLPDI